MGFRHNRRWFSHLLPPLTFVVLASVLAFLSLGPSTPSNESAGGIGTFALLAPQTENSVSQEQPHAHDLVTNETSGEHGHGAGSTLGVDTHQHAIEFIGSPDASAGHDHAHDSTVPDIAPTGPIVSVDDPRLTPAQQNAARSLLVATRSRIAALPDTAALTAAGYVSAGDNSGGLQHWVKDAFTKDGRELDPSSVESFMVKTSTGRTVGAMYILEPGKTMANVPDIAGELTTWHVHDPICFSTEHIWRFVSFANNGNCPLGSAVRNVPPMMHVWADDPKCGPFVGTEGHGASTCGAHSH